jgi:hypothetical protein
VAGVQDMRFQELMPDVLHWLGITQDPPLASMSNMKYDAITKAGIEVVERVNIPDELIPADARVEMDAKTAAGYFTPGRPPTPKNSRKPKAGGWTREPTDLPTPPACPVPAGQPNCASLLAARACCSAARMGRWPRWRR